MSGEVGDVARVSGPRHCERRQRLVALCCAAAAVSGQAGARPQAPAAAIAAAGPRLPGGLSGAWQARIEGRMFKLRADYTIELKIGGGGGRAPIALVSYFAGDQQRPSSICRTQLALLSNEGEAAVFGESLNYRMGKDSCPIWDQITIAPRDGKLWVQWRDVAGRKTVVKMEGPAERSSSGAECRPVGGSGGQLFCRTPDGDWVAKPR